MTHIISAQQAHEESKNVLGQYLTNVLDYIGEKITTAIKSGESYGYIRFTYSELYKILPDEYNFYETALMYCAMSELKKLGYYIEQETPSYSSTEHFVIYW